MISRTCSSSQPSAHHGMCRTAPAGGMDFPNSALIQAATFAGYSPSAIAVARKMPLGWVPWAAAICARVCFPSAVTVTAAGLATAGTGMWEITHALRTVEVPLKALASTPPAVPHCHSSHDFHGAIRLPGGAVADGHANHSGHPVQDVRCWPTLWLV